MSGARLWVTGLGLVTPLGAGVEASWERLVRGDRAVRGVRLFDTRGQRATLAAEVDGVALPAGARAAAAWSRPSVMALAAAGEAMRAASVDVRTARVGLVAAGTTGGMFENERVLARLHADRECEEAFPSLLSHPMTATGDRLDEALGPFVRVRAVASACSSGANAIVIAAQWLLAGEVDVVVAGGADGLCQLTFSGFNALGAVDPEPCRPFDRRRRGLNLGEGAGFLVLERARSPRALERGVRPIAELAGWALGAEAHHITNPASDGLLVASLLERAMARAGLTPRDIDYVNAHGTGTLLNDAMEAAALSRALGGEIDRIPVSSSKAQIGHTLGGAGAIEAAITALVVARRTLVPTAGLDEPDPALALVPVPHVGRVVPRVRAALSNAFGFGGMDTVLVFTEPDFEASDRLSARGPATHSLADARSPRAEAVVTGAAVFGACGLLGSEACATVLHVLAAQVLTAPRPSWGRAVDARFASGIAVDPDAHLDIARARRLDRTSRLAAVAVQEALAEARAPSEGTGVVLGNAYGNVDASGEFMHRVFEKGPRAASPAEFPNLVPSSPVGHVSIYLGLQGPTFATADLSLSGEVAFTQAVQLVAGGEAERVVAAAVEPRSHIVERALARLFAPAHSGERAQARAVRTDLSVAMLVESEREASRRGARVLARVRQLLEWRRAGDEIRSLRAPGTGSAEVILPRSDDEAEALLARTPWRSCPRLACLGAAEGAVGESDGLGAVALAVAVGRIATGRADEALVLGVAGGRGYAIVLGL